MINKDFYWLLPDYLKLKLDDLINQYSNEPWFDEAWIFLTKQYKAEPKAKWSTPEQVMDYFRKTHTDILSPESSDDSDELIASAMDDSEDTTLTTSEDFAQTAAVAERSEDEPMIIDIHQAAGNEPNRFGFKTKKKHKH